MKEWKFKYMTKEQIEEVDQLWKDGHEAALTAYGFECAGAGVKGYKRGELYALLIGVGLGVTYVAAKHLGRYLITKYMEKQLQKNESENVEET